MATAHVAAEQRVLLRNIDWETYERLLDRRGESPTPRYTYDRGGLEIMSPLLPEHEGSKHNIELLVELLTAELAIDILGLGAMTMKREDLEGGVEPDASFYIQSEASVRDRRRIDLTTDPPPDLVVEVDISHPTLDKLPIYARFGVPEVWCYDGSRLEVHVLEGEEYRQSPESRALPGVERGGRGGLDRGEAEYGLGRVAASGEGVGAGSWRRNISLTHSEGSLPSPRYSAAPAPRAAQAK